MGSNRDHTHEDDDDEEELEGLTAPNDTLRPTGGNAQIPGVSLHLSRSSNPDTPRMSQSLEFRVNVRFKVKVADLLNRIGESGLETPGVILAPEVEDPGTARNGESELEATGKIPAPEVEDPGTARNGESELEATGKIPAPEVNEPLNLPAKGTRGKKRKRTHLRSFGSKKSSPSKSGVTKEFFVVEKILDKRCGPRGEEYLLRWAGCSEECDSWESPSHMQCDEFIAEFSKQREPEIEAERSSDGESHQNSCSHQQDAIDIAANNEVLEIPFGSSSSAQVSAPQAKDDADPTLKIGNKSNSGDSDVNSTTSNMTLPSPFSLRDKKIGTETSSMNTRASSRAAIICSTIGLFPYIDLSSINHKSPPKLIPMMIVSTKIGYDGHRWFLVYWENYLYPFAWVRDEFIKRHFVELIIKFYEKMLYKKC